MRRALAILAAFGLGWIAPVASAQPAWLAGGPYLEPETGAAILFGACPKGIGTDRLCGTVAGWHDDTPLPGPVARKPADRWCSSKPSFPTPLRHWWPRPGAFWPRPESFG
ncbi:MAG: hypothetical protein JKP98_22085 [Rhodobacteraceae bacterium]|nr:hypothetical protein [Paracoccaceae bacterium]